MEIHLQDGDRLEPMGGMEVVHSPGHTPGSISLYFAREGLLIAGDALQYRRGKLGLPSRLFTARRGGEQPPSPTISFQPCGDSELTP